MPLSFKIVTPEGIAYEDAIERVTIPTASGEITVLPRHAPLVSLLRPGEMIISKTDHRVHMAVDRGVILVRPGSEVVVLSDSVARAEEIDVAAAEAARERAQKMLSAEEQLTEVEFSRFRAVLDRELARLKVGSRHQKRNIHP